MMGSGPVPPQNSIPRRHLGGSQHHCRSDFRGVDSCRYRELDPGACVVDYTLSDYHERSKHRVNRYAPGPGELDWANQPNPFRYYEGSTRIELPLLAGVLETNYSALRCGRLPAPHLLSLQSIAILFELSLGISAWKVYGNTSWALRCNPSSGNLHPTEGYLVTAGVRGLAAGVYHYVSGDHSLERRGE